MYSLQSIYTYIQLPSSLFQTALEDISNGVYFGWAVIESASSNKGRNMPIKAIVNVVGSRDKNILLLYNIYSIMQLVFFFDILLEMDHQLST